MKRAIQQTLEKHQETSTDYQEGVSMRLNKYLTLCGYCSRREADRLIEQGRITIDGIKALVGMPVMIGQAVLADGQLVTAPSQHVYLVVNKPVGITCTLEEDIEGNIGAFMNFKQRIFPVGRLDKDSSGLLILTSDGDIVNKILRSEHDHEKEYEVVVNRDIQSSFIQKMANGVEITNMKNKKRTVTKRCKVEQVGPRVFRIVLTQGLNRQIRRMCTALGYRVVGLRRDRIMNLHLGDLKVGYWRYLTVAEMDEIKRSIQY